MRQSNFATWLTVSLSLSCAAQAQMVTPPPSSATALPPSIELTVAPRAWYLFESFSQPIRRNNSGNFITSNGDEYFLGGGAITATLASLPATTFTLSGLFGSNAVGPEFNQMSMVIPPGNGAPFSTVANTDIVNKTDKIDIEFLAQTAVPDSDWSWIVGGRLEHRDIKISSTTTINPAEIVMLPAMFSTQNSSVDAYTGKIGLGWGVPLTAAGNLSLFGNGLIDAGVVHSSASANVPDFGVIGPELSIGIQYAVTPNINFDARYRGIVYFAFGTASRVESQIPRYTVYQGPMVEVSFKF